jgi:hypothetical protein
MLSCFDGEYLVRGHGKFVVMALAVVVVPPSLDLTENPNPAYTHLNIGSRDAAMIPRVNDIRWELTSNHDVSLVNRRLGLYFRSK